MGLPKVVDIDNIISALIVGIGCLGMLWAFLINQSGKRKEKLPAGPPSFPIVGNLHLLRGKLPHRTLRDLSQKYGPLMFMRLGSVPTLVVSSSEIAREFLKTHNLLFANRPEMRAAKRMVYNSTDITFVRYGPFWRQMRKVCTVHALSPTSLQSSQFVRAEEVSVMIHSILEDSRVGSNPVSVTKAVASLTANIICRMFFGRKYSAEDEGLDGRGFKAIIRELMSLLGAFNIADFIPWLEWMDIQGLNRRMKSVHNAFDAFMEKILRHHEMPNHLHHADFVGVLLAMSKIENINDTDQQIKITRDNIKAVMLDMLAAGMDTSSATIEWAMSELLRNPSVMKKLEEDIESVVGMTSMVHESHLPRLHYLHAVVKETLRLHPPAPLLLPRESVEACTVSGYHVPAKARLIVNYWAIGRDPMLWEDAESFKPERFIGSSVDFNGQNFEFIPFGSGKRVCVGMHLGITVVELALAQLFHCFDWRLPDGMNPQDLDMEEEDGLTAPRAVHLLAVPSPRHPMLA